MKIIILFLLSLLLIGCATIPQGTAPSSSPLIDRSGENLKYQVIGTSTADAGHFSLFGFIPFGRTDIDEAIYKAIKNRNGDNLINLCYNVNYVSYFIFGSRTSITVKGDVIKYNTAGQTVTYTDSRYIDFYEPSTKLPANHIFSANVISNGLGFSYALLIPFGSGIFGKIGLGYRSYEDEIETYNWGWGDFTDKFTIDYQFIPLTFSMGINTEGIIELDIPLNGFASIGAGYYPDVKNERWVNFGWNLGIGAEYKVIPNLALGVFYNYHQLFVAENNILDYWGIDVASDKPSFSDFGLMLRLVP